MCEATNSRYIWVAVNSASAGWGVASHRGRGASCHKARDTRTVTQYDHLQHSTASFEQIRRQDALAAEYLSFIACIDRMNIPQSLLLPGLSVVQQTKALGTLTGYAFITERQQTVPGSSKERLFDMHRLVHIASIWLSLPTDSTAFLR